MSKKLYEESNIQAIAQAIRYGNGSESTYLTSEMAQEIRGLKKTLIQKTVHENGIYLPANDNADGYSQFIVDVNGGPSANIIYNEDFSINTTGDTSWTANYGSSQASRRACIDGWLLANATAQIVSDNFVISGTQASGGFMMQQLNIAPWLLNKNMKYTVVINDVAYEETGIISSLSGVSMYHTWEKFSIYIYGYSGLDVNFTINVFNNSDEFVINSAKLEFVTSESESES